MRTHMSCGLYSATVLGQLQREKLTFRMSTQQARLSFMSAFHRECGRVQRKTHERVEDDIMLKSFLTVYSGRYGSLSR